MTVPIIIILGMGPLDPIEFGLDSGDGFVFSTLVDDNRDGRIELFVPLDSKMAIGINQDSDPAPGLGSDGEFSWDPIGSSGFDPAPYEVPLFFNTAGGPLGVDYGTLLPPPTSFSPGQVLSVADGKLAEWDTPRFLDTTGVAGLADFVALRDGLPNFTGSVTVSDVRIRVEAVVPEPTTLALMVTLLLFGIVYSCRSREKWVTTSSPLRQIGRP